MKNLKFEVVQWKFQNEMLFLIFLKFHRTNILLTINTYDEKQNSILASQFEFFHSTKNHLKFEFGNCVTFNFDLLYV